MKKFFTGGLPVLLLLSCAGGRSFQSFSSSEKSLADSLLAQALDHEALYSIADTIKPISSVKYLSYPIAKDSTHPPMEYRIATNQLYLDSIAMYQRICDELSSENVRFVLIPFQQTYRQSRNMEIYAVNLHRFKNVISEHAAFFGQFGITPVSDPAQVITTIEYEGKYDRWRGYGYLFGYPEYAVDFFVSAGQKQDSTGNFVKRSFFHIPVYAAERGHFTYAMPEGHAPGVADSLLYHQATKVLARYERLRTRHANKDGVKAMRIKRKF